MLAFKANINANVSFFNRIFFMKDELFYVLVVSLQQHFTSI